MEQPGALPTLDSETRQETTVSEPADRDVLTAQHWPIAAAMNQFPPVGPDGTATQDQSAERWAAALTEVREAGYTEFDPMDSWLRLADLTPERLREFSDVVADVGLTIPAVSTSRRSPVDPEVAEENMAYLHRAVDVAAAVGASVVSVGFFRALTPRQQAALWFWTVEGPVDSDDPRTYRLAVERIRELAGHAEQVGVQVSLEMYEDTYLGTADAAVRFLTDVDSPHVGLNPDFGNLVRLHRPVEQWEDMVRKTVPLANYWHIKNYTRTEDGTTGQVVTAPAPLELGIVNYRWAVRYAVAHGFRGAFCTEHYGGDGLGVGSMNREYLRGVLPARTSR